MFLFVTPQGQSIQLTRFLYITDWPSFYNTKHTFKKVFYIGVWKSHLKVQLQMKNMLADEPYVKITKLDLADFIVWGTW